MNDQEMTRRELLEETTKLRQIIRDLEEKENKLIRTQTALRQSEEQYRVLLSESSDPIFSFTPAGQYRYVNKAFALGVGKPQDQIIGQTIWDVFPKDEADKRFSPLSEVFRTGAEKVIEVRVPRTDGDRYYVTTITPTKDERGNTVAAICSSKEITERKRMEVKLAESEARFRAQYQNHPTPTFTWRKKGDDFILEDYNAAAEAMTNGTASRYLNHSLKQMYGNRPDILRDMHRCFSDKSMMTREYVSEHFMPQRLLVTTFSFVPPDLIMVHTKDITEKKLAEEALHKSQDQLRALSENLADGMVYQIDSGRDGQQRFFSYISPAVEWLHGLRAEEVIRNPSLIYDQIEEEYRTIIVEAEARAYQMRTKLEVDLPIRLPSGEVRWRRFISSPAENEDGSIVWNGIELDITERRKAEEEHIRLQQRLLQAEKMEALGTLAGGVAHDLNNVLGILVGYSELLLDRIAADSPLRNHVEKMMQSGTRAAAIVQDLLTLARRGVHAEGVINLNTVIADFQKTPEYEALCASRPQVQVQIQEAPDLLNIKGSAAHISKTFMNLITNAMEAMPQGGTLTISTENISLDRPVHGYDEVRQGDYVYLCLSDTGEGIAEEDLKHIFEPFYTKKVMGRSGTGLGLSVVWGTVKDHQGYIDVYSQPGKGATFILYFPVTREAPPVGAAIVPLSDYIGKEESILVVDDILEQRELASSILGNLNYKVNAAATGEEAVEYLKTHRADLIILDMIMEPGMDGLETYRCVLEIHPKQKAIIVSGFSESDRVRTAQAMGAGAYVRKPYTIEKLGLAVRKELDRS